MNIALIGYGNMGKLLHDLAESQGTSVKAIIDPEAPEATAKEIDEKALEGVDVCLDFTVPDAVLGNAEKVAAAGKNLVIGTTGWYDDLEKVKATVEKAGIGGIYASNFSIGVNLFFRIVENAAGLLNEFPEYDVFAFEEHHNKKKDSPSGTAKSVGEILLKKLRRKEKLVFDKLDRQIKPEELHVASVRAGSIPGTHVVGFDSSADTIELKHTARSREGFALGALKAAEWINGKKGFYSIDDMMKEIIKEV